MPVSTNPAYNIQITMDPATVRALKGGGFSLYGFLGAGWSNDKLLAPLLWFSSQEFGETTEFAWSPQAQVFVSSSEIAPNSVIAPSSSIGVFSPVVEIGPSQQLTRDAEIYHIWIGHSSSSSVTAGLSQLMQDQYNPYCAFELAAGVGCVMRPIPKVLLMIAVDTITIGTVVLNAVANGVCVDLTDQVVDSAKVAFDINAGWSWTSADNPRLPTGAISAVTTGEDIAPLLTLQLESWPGLP
jgi:hypothetical protein